jgi:hypothetical protein
MKTYTFTFEQEHAVRIALELHLAWLEHNINRCAKTKEPAHSEIMDVFQTEYADTLGALNVLHTPKFIPKMYPDEITF